jgi:hypothetical protein
MDTFSIRDLRTNATNAQQLPIIDQAVPTTEWQKKKTRQYFICIVLIIILIHL